MKAMGASRPIELLCQLLRSPERETAMRTHLGPLPVLLAGLALALPAARATAGERRPNVLLIMTDNHGAWTLGCYGNREIRTPNIDRLAADGMRFTRAYCTNSVCSPSRA